MADGLAVSSDVQQALLGNLYGALLALAFNLQGYLLLLEFKLFFPQLEQRPLGQHNFTEVIDHVNAVVILRRGADSIAEIDIEESKSQAFGLLILLVICQILLGVLIILLIFLQGYAAIHLEYLGHEPSVLLLDIEVPHYSFCAGMMAQVGAL